MQRLVMAPSQLYDRQIVLTLEQHHYLNRVLRLQGGDRFVVMDGQGRWWLAELLPIQDANPFQAKLLEEIAIDTELPVQLTLVAALPKGNAFDEVVRQATELGVSCIIPVISDRTLLQPSPQRLDRWRRIVQEAAEQSERQIVPAMLEPTTFAAYLRSLNQQVVVENSTRRYLGVTRCVAPALLSCLTPTQLTELNAIEIAIGPEGGWSDCEIEQAIAAGFQAVSFGKRIFRTVTAPLVALALIASVLEQEKSI
ncbi:MAG: 16S rRNA (uracil(1498)-N(3))-methyltransferase [Scytolyngbya sp. HA4215-MV1]|nr:16S rRNA (uracil(1498)-N(3))-methyltransferase [Scytolyngbya sp. HA4215-MV1]